MFQALALALTAVMAIWSPTSSCGGLSSTTPPIIGFELALDRVDLHAVFGPAGACRDALVASFGIVNRLDYLFLSSYGAFMFCAMAAFAAGRPSTLTTAGMIVAVAAPVADALENVALLSIDVAVPEPWLPMLAIATRAKFVLVAAWSALFAIALVRREPGKLRWLAIVAGAAALAGVAGLVTPAAAPALIPATTVSWLAVLIWAVARARRERE